MQEIETMLKSLGIAVIPELAARMPVSLKQQDKIQLTPEGHRIFAEHLLPRVISALKSASGEKASFSESIFDARRLQNPRFHMPAAQEGGVMVPQPVR